MNSINPKVSVVLNAYRRRRNLPNQVQAVLSQTVEVQEILIWENGRDRDSEGPLRVPEATYIASSTQNLGVWARFTFALNAKGDFLWILDDDTIPGPRWLESALGTFQSSPGVIGSRGLIFRSDRSYLGYREVGPNFPNSETTQVDLLGHNWVFPRKWLAYFFAEYGNRFDNPLAGEDIHLSYSVQKHLGLGCFVPPHLPEKMEHWGELVEKSLYSGRDAAAISADLVSLKKFEKAFRHYVSLGFTPLAVGQATAKDKALGLTLGRFPILATKFARLLGKGTRS